VFLRWTLKNVFEKAEDEFFTDAPYDFGIDAYFEQGEDEVYIFQSKYGSSHSLNCIGEFRKDFEDFKQTEIDRLGLRLHDLNLSMKEDKPSWSYITDVELTQAEKEEALKHSIEIYGIHEMADEMWRRNVQPYKGKKARLEVTSALNHGNYYVCVVPLKSLAEFIDGSEEYIFQSNIRQWLQFRTKVNKQIRETLKTGPRNFFKYNNGITLVCDDIEPIGQVLQLVSPQIVNGAQTCSAVFVSWKENPNLEGEVLATIMKAVSPEDMNLITRYRNSQNAIRGKDFVSLEDLHREIRIVLKNLGYFYEIQAGSFALLDPRDQSAYRGNEYYNKYLPSDHENNIASKDAIQAYIAGLKQNPSDAYGRLYKFMPPDGDNYKDAFPYDLQHDYRLFLYPYLAKEYAKHYLK